MEAFSDGVIAVIITIMVLEMKVPHAANLAALRATLPIFVVYAVSFVYVGIYWSNHHHLVYTAQRVDGRVLWSNLHLLFWLSLIPFTTAWVAQDHLAAVPTAAYGCVLILSGFAYKLLQNALIAANGKDSVLARAIGGDFKGYVSLAIYAIAIGLAFVNPWISGALYVTVAAIWLVPDRRIERLLPKG